LDFPFIEYGNRDERPPLVLLHGISLPPTHWGRFPEEMDRYTVAIGLPLDKHAPTIPTLGHYAKRMMPAIHEIAEENHYDLLGLSWGGLLAQQIAIDDKRKIRGLVLAGTIPAVPMPYLGLPNAEAMAAVWSNKRTPETIEAIYGGDVKDNPELTELIDRPIDMMHHLRQLCAISLSGTLALQRMFELNSPETLVMAGDNDPLIPYYSVCL